jgi:hypothetical protein
MSNLRSAATLVFVTPTCPPYRQNCDELGVYVCDDTNGYFGALPVRLAVAGFALSATPQPRRAGSAGEEYLGAVAVQRTAYRRGEQVMEPLGERQRGAVNLLGRALPPVTSISHLNR